MISRNTEPGNRSATSVTNSHSPRLATPAISSAHRRSTCGAISLIALGANSGASSRRHAVCSGGSSIVGMNRYGGSGSGAKIACEENNPGSAKTSWMASWRVKTQ